ncbi:hypothetical protein HI914_07515 [Erysiphe necator]|uniref:Putative sun domain protein n=1 Tax=Uncinula necator TaxID=52586 RepID=A0A0B1PDU4_UNCNE|nr:hypothetical protein HI914_07515 [Erysiphe necator]KHJ35530.1 putative sun domain protein [Erysiphe necator]
MRSYCVCISYVATLLLLQFCNSDAHVHKHHIRFAPTHRSHSHLKLIKLRQADLSVNETTDATPKSHFGLNKEVGKCEFPSNAGLTPITPHAKNAGWAMAPDEQCSPGSYCPYACPSGMVMAQWNPNAKAYTYPQSMDGGLYCDQYGQVKKPFPDKPYCVSGTGGVGAHNKVGKGVSFCQTVLPGGESMLIPTHVENLTDLAVPGTNYWCKTAAHYYINPPGVKVEEACVWGDETKPVGNWSPYVAGANTDESGQTFVKVGWNPIFTGSKLSSTPLQFGVKITCDGTGCNGIPCTIDPAVGGVGKVQSINKSTGAGGADFCVVTVPKGIKANIEVFPSGTSIKDVSEEMPSTSNKIESSSSSSSVAQSNAKPAATESKDLEETSNDSHITESSPVNNTPKIEAPSTISSSFNGQEKQSNLFSPLPLSDKEFDMQENNDSKPKTYPTQDSKYESTQTGKDWGASTTSSSEPGHLFDEPSTNLPQPKNDIPHSNTNHSSSKSTLFETESKFTSMASAGTEHMAAVTSHETIDSSQSVSMAPISKIFTYSSIMRLVLLISVFNFF